MTIPPDTCVFYIEPRHYWPGGIPTSIRFQPELEIPEDQLKEECKGWIHFVSKNWIPREAAGDTANSDYETGQRRDLMVKWAEAEQGFRDWYHDQAPIDPDDGPRSHILNNPPETRSNSHSVRSFSFIVLPKVAQDQTNPGNHVQWIKQLLLLNRFDRFHGNQFLSFNPDHYLVLVGDSLDGQSDKLPTSKEEVMRWMCLENADFDRLYMTRQGQAICSEDCHFFMLDQSNLDEGTLSVVRFGHNGALKDDFRFRPFFIEKVMVTLYEESFDELEDSSINMMAPRNRREHVDMNGPVLSMLESARAIAPWAFRSPRLADDVEHYAPGYLALEAQGREVEYDEAPLIEAAFAID